MASAFPKGEQNEKKIGIESFIQSISGFGMHIDFDN